MNSKKLPMTFIKRVHAVMKKNFYVHAKLACTYDTHYDSWVNDDKTGMTLELLEVHVPAKRDEVMTEVSRFLKKAGIIHETREKTIYIDFKKNGTCQ